MLITRLFNSMIMKQLIFTFCSLCLTLALSAQIRTAEEVKTTFSPKNLMSNNTEFSLQKIYAQFGIELQDIQGNIQTVSFSKDNNNWCECVFNDNNQISQIKKDDKELCKFVYNSNSKVEVIQFESGIIAITYDKKGRVASEAILYPYQSKNVSTDVKKANTVMSDNYIFTDLWQSQKVTDSTARIYLYEVKPDGKTQEWAIKQLFSYSYKGNGLMKTKVEIASNPYRDAIFDFSYKKKILDQQVKTYSNSDMVEGTTYFYENGNLSKVNKGYFKAAKGKNPPLISSETNTMTYDSLGNMTEYTSTDGYRQDICTLQYDSNKRIVKVLKQQENGEQIPMFQCEYNDKNIVVKLTQSNGQQKISYDYDEKGNWKKQTIVKNNGTSQVIDRVITYK